VGTGLTGEEHQSDRCATTQSGDFEAEDTRRDRMACVEAKQGAVAGHPSDGENLKTSKTALEGGERMAAISWNPSSFVFLFSLPIFLGFP
jgi:hypothetical protein